MAVPLALLEDLLSDQPRTIGTERCVVLSPRILLYRDPYGSYRFVRHLGGVKQAAIQVVSHDGVHGLLGSVYTAPRYRRRGYASELYRAAAAYFHVLTLSTDVLEAGRAWVESL